MSDNLSFLLTCAAECLNNWGYDKHGKHIDDGVKEITRLRAENEKLRQELKQADEMLLKQAQTIREKLERKNV